MNHTTRYTLRFSALLLVGAPLYLAGCGPEYLEDVAAISAKEGDATNGSMQHAMRSAGMNHNGARGTGNDQGMMRNRHQNGRPDHRGAVAGVGAAGIAPEGIAATGVAATPVAEVAAVPAVPAVPAVAAVAPVLELPPVFLQAPPLFEVLPEIVTFSAEQNYVNQPVITEQPVFIHQPMEHVHTVATNYNQENIFHQTEYHSSSLRNGLVPVATATETAAILPTTVIVEPTVLLPGVVAPAPIAPIAGPVGGYYPLYDLGYGAGLPPFCAPYLSGGFFNNCVPVGPYWR